MCLFVTAVLPGSADVPGLADVAARHGLRLALTHNASVEKQLHPGERLFFTNPRGCDCDTALGSLRSAVTPIRIGNPEAEIAKLRRKGWTAAKISRRVEQRKAHDTAEDKRAATLQRLEAWRSLLAEMLTGKRTPSVGLLMHQYAGNVVSEDIALHRRESLRIDEVTLGSLGQMSEDVVYDFVA